VVRDIEAKARAWSDILGLPMPQIHITDTVDTAQTEYQGERTIARAKLAFFHMGQVDIELIEPIGEPSTWKDQLDQHGDSLHHIAFQVNGMTNKVAYLESNGIPPAPLAVAQRGERTTLSSNCTSARWAAATARSSTNQS